MDALKAIAVDPDMREKLETLKTTKLAAPPEAVLCSLRTLREAIDLGEDVEDMFEPFSEACRELLSLHWLHKKSKNQHVGVYSL